MQAFYYQPPGPLPSGMSVWVLKCLLCLCAALTILGAAAEGQDDWVPEAGATAHSADFKEVRVKII